ncbi:fimbrial protein [Cronobacter universalis]|uniref:Fimbrial protein n=1 Tax=Cronobacter universalis NCTC 9529 TaxID=1074000 RepID=A0AAC8ZSN6_9ENTR|nr:fimbrial protein [Cronobacter universalis]ALB56752.1 fimbrial protein [Cronobacter universalis NCTC 9529]ELY3469372.1 fimbrial protein [Cronobacter universalis]ELY3760291.1 fimbrial protein [Cronobacter universalis]ELY6245474.1 fimbrial protein [Cronobacter universalis]CCK16578.1 Fimbrial protein [Cronobacter universalis NCTC 9529]
MKKTILSLAVSALFMTGMVHAETNPNDVSATLSVTGTVVEDIADACTVVTNKQAVALSGDVTDLINQGQDSTSVETVQLSIVGENCASKVEAGTMAYKFTGTADNADGTVLANSDASSTAAKGVGVGIFTGANKPVKVNSADHVIASASGTIIGLQMVKLNGQNAEAGNVTSSVTIEIERL